MCYFVGMKFNRNKVALTVIHIVLFIVTVWFIKDSIYLWMIYGVFMLWVYEQDNPTSKRR